MRAASWLRTIGRAALAPVLLLSAGAARPSRGTPERHDGSEDVKVIAIVSAANQDRRAEVFGLGTNGHVYHRWELPTGGWSDWTENIVGNFSDLRVQRASGRLFLVGVDQGEVVIRAQNAAGSAWSDATLRTGTDLRRVAVATDQAGRIRVVAIGGSGDLRTMHSLNSAPQPRVEDWSAWQPIGGEKLARIELSQDGDGRMTLAATGTDGSVYLAQQVGNSPQVDWGDWPLVPPAGISGIQLVLGKDRKLWLLGIGDRGALYGRSLPLTNTDSIRNTMLSGLPTKPEGPRTRRPDPPANPRSRLPSPRHDPKSTVLPRFGDWTPWAVLSNHPFIALGEIATSTNRSGAAQIAGISSGVSVVHMTQNADGSWPQLWTVLPSDERMTEFANVSLTTNNAGDARVFVTDIPSGKVFTISRSGTAMWPANSWIGLGKIPGVQGPDVFFSSRLCFELVDNAPIAAGLDADSVRRARANELRESLSQEVPAKIAAAASGTPLAGLLRNVNAASRCMSNGQEVIGVWLNHEVWPGAFDAPPAIAEGEVFAYQIPAATLVGILDGQISQVTKQVTEIDITGHEVKLSAPDALEIHVDAKWTGIAFSANVLAKFSLVDQSPRCISSVTATRPAGLYAILLMLAFPVNATSSLLQFGDGLQQEQLDRIASDVGVICRLTDAVLSSLFLPKKKDQPLQMLVLPYDRLNVDPALGIIGYGGIPIKRAPQPTVTIGAVPVGSVVAGVNQIQMMFIANLTEMSPKGRKLQWSSSIPERSLVLDGNLGVGSSPFLKFFTFSVPPAREPKQYDLGTMRLVVTNDDGQRVETTVPVTARTRKP